MRTKNSLPSITEQMIKARANQESFDRGMNYYRRGAIYSTVWRGDTLEGLCQGSQFEPYRIRIELDEAGIQSTSCSCPYDWGGDCKHIVALLLMWVNDPKQFARRPMVDDLLRRKSKNELIAAIKLMLEHDPSLENILNLDPPPARSKGPRPPVDPENYRRQFRAVLSRHKGWDTVYDTGMEISGLVGIGRRFLESGDRTNAARVLEAIIDEGLSVYGSVYDDDDAISSSIRGAIEALSAVLEVTPGNDSEHLRLVEVLWGIYQWEANSDGYSIGDAASFGLTVLTTETERQWLCEQVESALNELGEPVVMLPGAHAPIGWKRRKYSSLLLSLDEVQGHTDAYLEHARENGCYELLFNKLVELGRITEALDFAKVHFQDWMLVQAARVLDEAGHADEAVALVEDAYWEEPGYRLADWLAEAYKRRGDNQKALKLQSQRFDERPSLALMQDVITLTPEDERKAVRSRLVLEMETQGQWALLTQFHTGEQDWVRAWDAVTKLRAQPQPRSADAWGYSRNYSWLNLALGLAKASEDAFPMKAAEAYITEAERLVDKRGRENYQSAVVYLGEARRLYDAQGKSIEWKAYIQGLKEKHSTLRALQDELKKAELG